MGQRIAGVLGMITGSALVFVTLLLINRYATLVNQRKDGLVSRIEVVRKAAPPPAPKPKPRPKPKARRDLAPTPLAPMANLLSGMNFGLPAFDPDALGQFDDQLLEKGENLVMTDETVDEPPRPIRRRAMPYPAQARARGQEGYVVLSILIDTQGQVEQARVLEAQPPGLFDEVARAGIMGWQFSPARYQGVPVKIWARQKIRFALD